MIQAQELRIGNWVNHEIMGHCQVTDINRNSFNCTTDGKDWFNSTSSKPIALTPEVLRDCGFVDHAIGYYHLGSFYISYSNSGLNEYQFRDYPVRFKYLHELMNLYFALTQTELTYKPDTPAK